MVGGSGFELARSRSDASATLTLRALTESSNVRGTGLPALTQLLDQALVLVRLVPAGTGACARPQPGPRRRSRRIFACLPTPGYRGHPITKSRTYSVTFGQIRRARQRFRQNPAGLDPEADIRQVLDADDDLPDGFVLESTRVFIGKGYLDLDQAAAAVTAAMLARSR